MVLNFNRETLAHEVHMTTPNSGATKTQSKARIVFPDPPERTPEEMTSFDHLAMTGNVYHLAQHFGNPDTTLVAGEHFMSPEPRRSIAGWLGGRSAPG